MAIHAHSIPTPARRLLRAAGPTDILTTAEIIALVANLLNPLASPIRDRHRAVRGSTSDAL